MKANNGFATKSDVGKLQKQIGGLDKRLGRVEDKFVWFREQFRIDLEEFREDFARQMRHEWQQKIDPILGDIKKHREQEVIWMEQNRRTWDLLEKIALKVGVPVDW